MPTREKQDYQDDEPNNQRQSGERYCEHNEPAADRHWIQQATEVEAKNYAWMDRAFIELAAEGRSEQHGRHQGAWGFGNWPALPLRLRQVRFV